MGAGDVSMGAEDTGVDSVVRTVGFIAFSLSRCGHWWRTEEWVPKWIVTLWTDWYLSPLWKLQQNKGHMGRANYWIRFTEKVSSNWALARDSQPRGLCGRTRHWARDEVGSQRALEMLVSCTPPVEGQWGLQSPWILVSGLQFGFW